jgi:hypothetical protein
MDGEQLPLDGMPEPEPREPEPTDSEQLELVNVAYLGLKRDYEMLTQVAGEDIREIVLALGLGDHPRDYSPHDVVHQEVLPAIAALRAKAASATKPAGLSGIPELDLGNGQTAQLVGRKLPPDVARSLGIRKVV